MGVVLLKRGIFVWRNGCRVEGYSPALAATVFVVMLVALIPDSLVRGVSSEKGDPRRNAEGNEKATSQSAMNAKRRFATVVGGLVPVVLAISLLSRAVTAEDNDHHAVLYLPSVMILGLLLLSITLFPRF